MSLFYDPETSNYIAKSSETLTSFKKSTCASEREIFASDPRGNTESQFFDDRTHEQLLQCIDTEKLGAALSQVPIQNAKKLWIVVSCGGFAPIHRSHIGLGKSALGALTNEKEGSYGVMAYFIPNNAEYTAHKLRQRGKEIPKYVQKEHIIGSVNATFQDEPNLDLCTLDLNRKSWCEWFVCASELVNMIRYLWRYLLLAQNIGFLSEETNIPELNFAFVGGEDLVRSKNGLHKGIKYVDFVDRVLVVPRDVEAEKKMKYPLARDVKKLDFSNLSLSSTKVRQLFEEENFEELEKVLHPKTLAYLIGMPFVK